MSRTHDVVISGFDLDRLENKLQELEQLVAVKRSNNRRLDARNKRLERERDAERALADRLAKALLSFCSSGMVWPNTDTPEKAIAAWKEARSE